MNPNKLDCKRLPGDFKMQVTGSSLPTSPITFVGSNAPPTGVTLTKVGTYNVKEFSAYYPEPFNVHSTVTYSPGCSGTITNSASNPDTIKCTVTNTITEDVGPTLEIVKVVNDPRNRCLAILTDCQRLSGDFKMQVTGSSLPTSPITFDGWGPVNGKLVTLTKVGTYNVKEISAKFPEPSGVSFTVTYSPGCSGTITSLSPNYIKCTVTNTYINAVLDTNPG